MEEDEIGKKINETPVVNDSGAIGALSIADEGLDSDGRPSSQPGLNDSEFF